MKYEIYYTETAKSNIRDITTPNFENMTLPYNWWQAIFDATVKWMRLVYQNVVSIAQGYQYA